MALTVCMVGFMKRSLLLFVFSSLVFLQVKSLKHKCVTSIGMGRYHTAMCTSTEVYTMGKNLGQLGFDKHHETTSCAPRVVSGR